MKIPGMLVSLQVAALTGLLSTVARAEDATGVAGSTPATSAAAVLPPATRAKLLYCKTCHGLSGQGFRADSTMPRLAGQQIEYLKNQVQAFIEHRRKNPIMYNVAHVLSPEMLDAIVNDFNGLNPKPLAPSLPATSEQIDAGKKLFKDGGTSASGDIPPCSSCHGDDAKGNGQFPRLAGQPDDYILRKLLNWTKERGQDPAKPDTSAIMQPIAHELNEQQVRAVAAYLTRLQ